VPANVEPGELGRFCERVGQRLQGPGVGDASMGPVRVVVVLVLAQGVEKMDLIIDRVRLF
jgi:hypothetical protein